jgi:hypothetical protein
VRWYRLNGRSLPSGAAQRQLTLARNPAQAAEKGGGTMPTAGLADNPTEEESMVTAIDVAELLATHPGPSEVDRETLARCIAECFDCARSCTACADADLAEKEVAELRRCIRLCLDCADICDATGRVVSRQTHFEPETSRAQVESCRRSCSACAEECERHARHHEHCRICADTCRRCEEACAIRRDSGSCSRCSFSPPDFPRWVSGLPLSGPRRESTP